jgi:hypothetical protein
LSDSTLRRWSFGEDGGLTLPIGVSIDANVDPLYPKIIADSDLLFSVQGQGTSGSAALSWTVDPDAAGQYAAVAVTRAGGDNLAKVVLQAQSDSGDAGTAKIWKFDETGTTTLPGALVKSTVAKTGVAADTGIPVTLSGAMGELGLSNGTYGPFVRGGVTFSVTVAGGGISGYINISSTTSYAVNDTIGQLTSEDLGDAPGQTTNINVDVVDQGFTDIDLTKSINKLTDGYYYLADGVEGQIMYLVRQNGSTAANISVVVANARWNGGLFPDQLVVPFQIPFTDMVTIIFTDGAWQSSTFGSLT